MFLGLGQCHQCSDSEADDRDTNGSTNPAMHILAIADLGYRRGWDIGGLSLVLDELDVITNDNESHASTDFRIGERSTVVDDLVTTCRIRSERRSRNHETQQHGNTKTYNFHFVVFLLCSVQGGRGNARSLSA